MEGDAPSQLEEHLRARGDAALAFLGLSHSELSILLCDDAFITELNARYRDRPEPTDVLSFSQREGEDAEPDDPILGDVVISVDTARRQSEALGHALEVELTVLLVHGLLHLLGHDHEDPGDAEQMHSAEARLLEGISGGEGAPLTARGTLRDPAAPEQP